MRKIGFLFDHFALLLPVVSQLSIRASGFDLILRMFIRNKVFFFSDRKVTRSLWILRALKGEFEWFTLLRCSGVVVSTSS